jgi:hypothetical protein
MRYIFFLSLILLTLSLSAQNGKITFSANEKNQLSALEDTLSMRPENLLLLW